MLQCVYYEHSGISTHEYLTLGIKSLAGHVMHDKERGLGTLTSRKLRLMLMPFDFRILDGIFPGHQTATRTDRKVILLWVTVFKPTTRLRSNSPIRIAHDRLRPLRFKPGPHPCHFLQPSIMFLPTRRRHRAA